MIIKLNAKFVAIFLAFIMVITLVFVEDISSNSVKTMTTDATQTVEEIRLPVLMYHHILTSKDRINDYVISPEQFEEDLKYIRLNGYETVSISDIMDYLNDEGELPDKPVLITFDDGYETTYEYAYPLLRKYDMCGVVSIIGKHTDIFSKGGEPHHLSYSHLSWEQLGEMVESGVFEVGNHTYDMHDTKGSERFGIKRKSNEDEVEYTKALEKDILGLNKVIKDELGFTPIVFAYPFGAVSKESPSVIKSMGFSILLTCEEKVNILKKGVGVPHALNRYNRAGSYKTKDYFEKFQ